jgi:hypothetical protein
LAIPRLWRNWYTRRLQVPVGFTPVEVRVLSAALVPGVATLVGAFPAAIV